MHSTDIESSAPSVLLSNSADVQPLYLLMETQIECLSPHSHVYLVCCGPWKENNINVNHHYIKMEKYKLIRQRRIYLK